MKVSDADSEPGTDQLPEKGSGVSKDHHAGHSPVAPGLAQSPGSNGDHQRAPHEEHHGGGEGGGKGG
jgi:hypothetical protein